MFTIKTTGTKPENGGMVSVNMNIYHADKVEELIDTRSGQKMVRMTIYPKGGMSSPIETVISLDADMMHGPCAVFVENSAGHTVQRISTDVSWEYPKND